MADAPVSTPLNITSQQNSSVNTARKLSNERIGRIAQDITSQGTDTQTGLQAILDAILAKPSA